MKSLFKSESSRWSLLIFAAAFVVRLANLLFLAHNDPAFYFPQVDSLWHHNWAVEIATKSFWGSEVFFRAPLYPYFLGIIYKLFGIHIFLAKLLQALASSITCVLLYHLGREIFTEKVGRIAAMIMVFYGTFIYYDSELLIEWLAILLNLLMLLMIIRKQESYSFKDWLIIGIIGGLSAITRPNVLALFPVYFIWLLLRDRKNVGIKQRLLPAVALTIGVLLCVLPVTLRNYFVAGDPVLISSQGGVNFYIGNNSQADGLTMVMPDIKLDLSVPWSEFVSTTNRIAESAVGHKLSASQVSSYWNGKAIDYIFSHPLDFLDLTTKRLIYFFSGFENSDQADIYRFKSYSPILNLLIFDHGLKFPFGLISPLALLGIMFPFKPRRHLVVVYIFMFVYIPTVILFLVTARHRLAVVALLIIFAAFSISKFVLFIQRRAYRQFAIYFSGFLILVLACNLKPFNLGYDASAQFKYQEGQVLDKQGKIPEAIASYRAAIAIAPIAEAYNNLGYDLSKKGDRAGAYTAYQRAIHSRLNFSEALNNLGQLFLSANQFDSAESYLGQALIADSTRPQVWLNFGDLYLKKGDPNQARLSYLRGMAANPNFVPLYNNLANLFLSGNMPDSAETYLLKVLAIDSTYAIANANYAMILMSRNEFGRARSYLARAIISNPELSDAHYNLGLLYFRTHQADSARSEWETVLQHDPNNAAAKRGLQLLKGKVE